MTPAARLRRIVGPRLDLLVPLRRRRRVIVRRAAFAAALLLALLALLEGRGERPAQARPWRGVDVVLCLDVSRSMLARDVDPARLVRAQREIRALAERSDAQRLALVVFAGKARLVVPLTRDGASLAALAELAGPASVERGGSDLGAALEVAADALRTGEGTASAVILLTDGEDLAGTGRAAAAGLGARGISVHALGLGTPRGSRIAVDGEQGASYLRDRAGREVVSTLEADSLRALTAAGGGSYATAGPASGALVGLYEDHVQPRARERHDAARRARRGAARWLVLAAFLLLLVDLAWADRSRP